MYRTILVAYNGTSESRSALYECVRLAPGPSAEIHLLVVVIPPSPALAGEVPFVIDREEDLIAAKRQMENELLVGHRILSDAGLQVVNHLEVGDPIDVIGKLANELGIELVIVGHSRHQSWAMRWWRGATDALLVEKVRCSILVAADAKH